MKPKLENEILYSMSNNPGNWKGPFYVNRKDPRLVVPKIQPVAGWTLNFGRPISYVIITIFVIIVAVSIFLIK